MFQFDENAMYMMPVHFGPCCGPRRNPEGKRFFEDGPQKSTQHILIYETKPDAIEKFLPCGFSVRKPYVIVTHKMHRDLPWLAGHGYNVTTFNVPVTYSGAKESVKGQYQLAIWENHADPILCGREQLGYSKLFADIEDIHTYKGKSKATLSSWNFEFLELTFDRAANPEDADLMKEILFDEENEGLMHYKYFPHTGDGFCEKDVAYVTISPRNYTLPDGLPEAAPATRSWCSGSLKWNIPCWEDMPTQYHVVQGLASLPVVKIVGASVVTLEHYNDVYEQRILE